MKDFFCAKCNQQHKFFTTIEFGTPKDILLKILSEKLEVEGSERWKIINKNIFLIKGIFFLSLKEKENPTSILAWIKVTKEEFIRYVYALEARKEQLYEGNGELFAEINCFKSSRGSKIIFQFNGINEFPKIIFIDKFSSLYQAQINGLSFNEMKEFVMDILHM